MKNLYKGSLVFLGLLFYLSQTAFTANAASCNWKSRNGFTFFWDSCYGKVNRYSVNANITFKSSSSCFKYQWTVNGNKAGNGIMMSFPITANGSYTICVKVTDTCRSCDTMFCDTRTITCVSNCNWKSRSANCSFQDSCKTAKNSSLNGNISFSNKSCFKYQWSINGVNVGNNNSLKYPITKNGVYSICVKVTDTCNNCDTSYCNTRTITCLSGNTCYWKGRNPATGEWDSCNGKKNKYSVNAYILYTNYYYKKCLKYQWKVNGNKAGNGDFMNYPISTNGTYYVCVTVSDTCMECDTTYCFTRNITCVSNSTCNWKSKNAYFKAKDTCMLSIKKYSVEGNISLPGSSSCYNYQWTVNGSNVGTNQNMSFSISQNGTYSVCVKVRDNCNNCDTTYCASVKVQCVPLGIGKLKAIEILKVYPNPSEGIINLDWSGGTSTYLISDANGQIVQTGAIGNGINIFDMNKYSTGLYLVQVRTENTILTEKVSVLKR